MNLPKSILVQLSKSRDIDRSIQSILENPQSSNLAADEGSLGQLMGWRSALAEEDWMELLRSRRPAHPGLRFPAVAALARLGSTLDLHLEQGRTRSSQ